MSRRACGPCLSGVVAVCSSRAEEYSFSFFCSIDFQYINICRILERSRRLFISCQHLALAFILFVSFLLFFFSLDLLILPPHLTATSTLHHGYGSKTSIRTAATWLATSIRFQQTGCSNARDSNDATQGNLIHLHLTSSCYLSPPTSLLIAPLESLWAVGPTRHRHPLQWTGAAEADRSQSRQRQERKVPIVL